MARGTEGAPRTGARAGVDLVVLVGALGFALAPLGPAFGLRALAPAVVGGLVLGTGAAALGAWRRWSALSVVAVVVVAYFVAGGLLVAPGTTEAGFVPTAGTLGALATGAATSWKQILTLQPPLGTTGTLLAAPFLLALVGAAAATATTLRVRTPARAALAALMPVAGLVGAIVLGTRQTVVPVVAGLSLTLVLLTWAAWRARMLRPRRVVALVALAGLAVAGGALGAPVVTGATERYVVRDVLVPPFDPRDYPSPLSAFRKYVKEDDATLLTVTGLPAGARVRLATLDQFDGVVWNVAGDGSAEGSGEFRRVGATIPTDVRGATSRIEIEVGALTGVWLPTVGQATAVTFADDAVAGDLRFNDATGGGVLTRGLTSGLAYTLDVVVPIVPDDATIGAAGAAPVILPALTGVPDAVDAKAADVARDAGTPVQVARSLQKALAETGYFSHGLVESGDYPSVSGHGADRVAALLGSDLMVGDGEQYASAMALMARQMGLPARVVLGFVPTDDQRTGDVVTVTAGDVEAWVEIAFTGYGWVPFDPTPPRTQTPQQDSSTTAADPQPQVVQPPPAPPEPVAAPNDDTEQPQAQDSKKPAVTESAWRQVAVVAAAASVPLAVVAGPLILVVALKARRRRRRRRDSDVVARVAGGWDELLDVALDLRTPAPPLATRGESARALADSFTGAAASGSRAASAVLTLAAEADATVFGPGLPSDAQAAAYWRRVEVTAAAMRGTVPWVRRFRSRVSLASLRHRRRERRLDARRPDRPSRVPPPRPSPRPTPSSSPQLVHQRDHQEGPTP
ncbi:transglutaminase [Cellulomonas sp. WB94]|uniref:transglutaminase domain-containing protein n=1 Tax=Cellulomonas sp. WB94 TaxID=2173174 RepID=UPI000D56A736|nr:transglutaminase domain-containing protein [Cellulomonas sp. WB94]PVU83793.1 transglutaminase [Cellulomonas sp. WB94]